jgi:hypothetical protein
MAFINGYRFNTKQIVNEAMGYLNTHHGLPVKGGVTEFDESSYTQHVDGYYYIAYDDEWTSILGEPIEIEINVPPINTNLP